MIVLGAVDDPEATTFDGLRSRAARDDRSERDVNQNASASLAVRILDGDNERPFGCEMDDAILNKIATAESETADLDFKSAFDPESTRDWCELVKDIVAVRDVRDLRRGDRQRDHPPVQHFVAAKVARVRATCRPVVPPYVDSPSELL